MTQAELPVSEITAAATAFEIAVPAGGPGPLVFASPHSGTIYPAEFRRQSRLPLRELRSGEDFLVDELFADAPLVGAPLIAARFGRSYVDLNRDPCELDPTMYRDSLPHWANPAGERVRSGLGVLPRIVSNGLAIYRSKMPFAEARERIDRIHKPYHEALSALLDRGRSNHGYVLLIDCHSMPAPPPSFKSAPQIILGDCFGTSAAAAVVDLIESILVEIGFQVGRNDPYAGGYTTASQGKPHLNRHAVQIEIDRSLYMAQHSLQRHRGFDVLKSCLEQFMVKLASELPSLGLGRAMAAE